MRYLLPAEPTYTQACLPRYECRTVWLEVLFHCLAALIIHQANYGVRGYLHLLDLGKPSTERTAVFFSSCP